MSEQSIANASQTIEELLATLDSAYWEAPTIKDKDLIYSTLSLLNLEYLEIGKLSIQDHGMPYEPISQEFGDLKNKLDKIQKQLDDMVMRTQTARNLRQLIPQVFALLN